MCSRTSLWERLAISALSHGNIRGQQHTHGTEDENRRVIGVTNIL